MDDQMQERPWLGGDSLSPADISVAPFIERFEANDVPEHTDWVKRPKLGDWWQRIKALDSFKTAFAFQPPEEAA